MQFSKMGYFYEKCGKNTAGIVRGTSGMRAWPEMVDDLCVIKCPKIAAAAELGRGEGRGGT